MLVGEAISRWARKAPCRPAIAIPDGPVLHYEALESLLCTGAAELAGHDLRYPIPVRESDPLAYLLRFLTIVRAGLVAFCQPGAPPHGEQQVEAARTALPQRYGAMPAEDALFYMGLTSGSTGEPKAVLRTHRSWVSSFALMTRLFGHPLRVAVPGSLSYSAALIASLHTLHEGGTLWLIPSLTGSRMLDLLEREHISATFLAPARLRAFLATIGRRRSSLPLTITTAGAKLDATTRAGIVAIFPVGKLFEYYGSVEMGFVTCMDPDAGRVRPDSVGRLCPEVECEVRDEQGIPVPAGRPGILYVRSPYQFAGYAQGGGMTADGWVSTGDWGQFDTEGFLFFLGRGEEQINTGGAKFFAPAIEAVLLSHPAVAEAAVIGLPDPRRGQVVGAVVTLQPGLALSAAALRRWCNERLPRGGAPRRVAFTPHLPYNQAGKVDRGALRRLLGAGGCSGVHKQGVDL